MKIEIQACVLLAFSLAYGTNARLMGTKRRAEVAPNQVRWASSGGGWRSMSATMAFANVFHQAGLQSDDTSFGGISSVSTESGSSWFSTQFFYSQQFFDNVTSSSPAELQDFVLQWMDTYQTFTNGLTQQPKCDFLAKLNNNTSLEILSQYCNVFVDFNGDWAAFIESMLQAASTEYGDSALVDVTMSPENKIGALSGTDLYVQTSLTPSARIRSSNTGVSLGPTGDTCNQVYSLPIPVQYSVSNSESLFYSSMGELSLDAMNVGISDKFNYPKGFKEYGLFPATDQTVLIDAPDGSSKAVSMVRPFKSSPNVAQMAAASSAAIGNLSPLVPSTLSQQMSVTRDVVKQSGNLTKLAAFDKVVDTVYNMEILDDLSVCTSWPEECGENDGRFIDGVFTDPLTLGLNIGQYQSRDNGDLSQTLKVMATLTNNCNYGPAPFLAYFDTDFNENVKPGDFLWPVNHTDSFNLPLQSPQIFEDKMDESSLSSITNNISGLNVTYAEIKGATTLENKAFQTKAGQSVDVLFIMLNSCIPTDIIGNTQIEQYKQPLADMALDISASQELVGVVKDFFNGN